MSKNVEYTLQDVLKKWPDAWAAFVGAFDTPVDRRKYEKDPKDIYAIDAVKRMHELNNAIRGLTEQGANTPTIWFVTAFDAAYMERQRTFMGKRPGHLFVEPVTDVPKEAGKVRIARVRDDGVKLYYTGPNQGHWFRRYGQCFTPDEGHKRMEILEWLAGEHGYYGHTSKRCFGMFFSEEAALRAVEVNSTDMHELLYTWLVVQKMGEGVDGFDNDGQIWFKWEQPEVEVPEKAVNDGRWVQTERPEETKNILSFSPVG